MPGRFDNLHSRVIAWLKVLLPLAAMAIVAALFLTSRRIDPEAALTGAGIDVRELARDVRIRNADFSAMTADGTAIRLVAESARPDPVHAGRIEAEAVIVTLDAGEGQVTVVRGAQAVIDRDEDRLTLSGDAAVQTSAGYSVRSEELTAALSRTELRSDLPVQALAPFGEITAESMRLTREGQDEGGGHVLVFNGGVKLVYRPSY